MDKTYYKKIVNTHTPKERIVFNSILSFFSGGFLGLSFTCLTNMIINDFNYYSVDAISFSLIIFILLASLLTALGVFDLLVSYCKCGLIIPITGFAHSITSSILDYKNDGMITGLGANVFKLSGSVLLYGIVSSFVFVVIKVIICLVF